MAQINLEAQTPYLKPADEFQVKVTLNAQNQELNAVSGIIHFDLKQFKLNGIESGQSVVPLWVEQPHYDSLNSTVNFSGVIPGGYSQDGAQIFVLDFVVLNNQTHGEITTTDGQALLNDGNGTAAQLSYGNFDYQVAPGNGEQLRITTQPDHEMPESFVPQVGRDQNILDGKWFMSFSTQDKISGIDHYEVKEGLLSFYHWASSPYVLEDQGLHSRIYIKAVDKAGNVRVESVAAQNPVPIYRSSTFYGIILVLILCFWAASRKQKFFQKLK